MATSGDYRDRLLGAWRLVSTHNRMEDTGEVRDLHGPDPLGFATFTPEGRVSFIITPSGRKPPTSDAEAAALFRNMSVYTGRFTVGGSRIVTEVDAAWQPAWEGSRQPRSFVLEGDTLTFTSDVQDDSSRPGQPLRFITVWTRDR